MKIPRQAPGEALVPVTVLLPPELRVWLAERALDLDRSLSWIIRDLVENRWKHEVAQEGRVDRLLYLAGFNANRVADGEPPVTPDRVREAIEHLGPGTGK